MLEHRLKIRRGFVGMSLIASAQLMLCGGAVAGGYHSIYEFAGRPADGQTPRAGLVIDAQGRLYGTTQLGGIGGCGTVFMLAPPASGQAPWTEQVLHNFCASPADGTFPVSPVVLGPDGSLYGTTVFGGTVGVGMAFGLSSETNWAETVLHSFNYDQGELPYTGLVFGAGGLLYGTTSFGVGQNYAQTGTDFSISPLGDQVEYKILHTFGRPGDGVNPSALTGVPSTYFNGFVGTTSVATEHGLGIVYALNLLADGSGHETVLYKFGPAPDVNSPGSPPIVGPHDGQKSLFGCAPAGGTHGLGGVYSLTQTGTGSLTETVLYNFGDQKGDPAPGQYSQCWVVPGDTTGKLYGTTDGGGAYQGGAFFELDPPAATGAPWTEKVDVSFNPNGSFGSAPQGAPVRNGAVFFGTLFNSPNGFGGIYELTP
jgi:hypothetical protein